MTPKQAFDECINQFSDKSLLKREDVEAIRGDRDLCKDLRYFHMHAQEIQAWINTHGSVPDEHGERKKMDVLLLAFIKYFSGPAYPELTATHIENFALQNREHKYTLEIIIAPMQILSLSLFAKLRTAGLHGVSMLRPRGKFTFNISKHGISVDQGPLLQFEASVDPKLATDITADLKRISYFCADGIVLRDGSLIRFADPLHGILLQSLKVKRDGEMEDT